jgi:carboxyl-terminal processing protease
VDGVVLDLSRNGGGSLTEAIGMTGLFIDRGVVVQVKNPSDSVQEHPDEDLGTSWDGPLVVLTSKLSASASEILAGAIRDYHRGIVVGDPATHGKGSVQTLMDLGERLLRTRRANYGALKVTIQKFYLPDGESTQLQGVPADVVLPSLIAKMDISEGDLKYALDFDRVPSSRHMVYNQMPPGLIDELRRNSMDRVAKDEEFLDMTRRIDLFVKQKENKEISLNEEEFLARRAELNAQKEEEEELLDQQLETEEIYNDNFYNREVLSITHDYIEGLRKQNLALAR